MCLIYEEWHVVPKNSYVTVHDAEGYFVGTMANAAAAHSVVNDHNKGLTTNKLHKTADGWITKTFRKGSDEPRRTGNQ